MFQPLWRIWVSWDDDRRQTMSQTTKQSPFCLHLSLHHQSPRNMSLALPLRRECHSDHGWGKWWSAVFCTQGTLPNFGCSVHFHAMIIRNWLDTSESIMFLQRMYALKRHMEPRMHSQQNDLETWCYHFDIWSVVKQVSSNFLLKTIIAHDRFHSQHGHLATKDFFVTLPIDSHPATLWQRAVRQRMHHSSDVATWGR